MSHSSHSSHSSIGLGLLLVTWLVLMILGAVTLGLASLSLGEPWSMVIALTIAGAKAVLVGLFFMHLYDHGGSVRVAAVVGVAFVVLLVLLTALDVGSRA